MPHESTEVDHRRHKHIDQKYKSWNCKSQAQDSKKLKSKTPQQLLLNFSRLIVYFNILTSLSSISFQENQSFKCSLNKTWKKRKFNINNIKRRKAGEFDSKVMCFSKWQIHSKSCRNEVMYLVHSYSATIQDFPFFGIEK